MKAAENSYWHKLFKDSRWKYLSTISVLPASLLILHFFSGSVASAIALVLLGFFPFLILTAWLTSTNVFKAAIASPWVKLAISAVGILAAAASQAWAAQIINTTLGLSPDHFPITKAVLTLFFFPLVFLKPLYELAMLIIVVAGGSILPLIILAGSVRAFLSRFGSTLLMLLVVSVSVGILRGMESGKLQLAPLLAWTADFHTTHRCTNLPISGTLRFKYLSDDTLLIAKQERNHIEFSIEPCTLAKNFTVDTRFARNRSIP